MCIRIETPEAFAEYNTTPYMNPYDELLLMFSVLEENNVEKERLEKIVEMAIAETYERKTWITKKNKDEEIIKKIG